MMLPHYRLPRLAKRPYNIERCHFSSMMIVSVLSALWAKATAKIQLVNILLKYYKDDDEDEERGREKQTENLRRLVRQSSQPLSSPTYTMRKTFSTKTTLVNVILANVRRIHHHHSQLDYPQSSGSNSNFSQLLPDPIRRVIIFKVLVFCVFPSRIHTPASVCVPLADFFKRKLQFIR